MLKENINNFLARLTYGDGPSRQEQAEIFQVMIHPSCIPCCACRGTMQRLIHLDFLPSPYTRLTGDSMNGITTKSNFTKMTVLIQEILASFQSNEVASLVDARLVLHKLVIILGRQCRVKRPTEEHSFSVYYVSLLKAISCLLMKVSVISKTES